MGIRRVLFIAVAASLVGGATLIVTSPPASAANVMCGQTITQSTTLTGDLSCPGNGVTIGADGVTFDLGGHTIAGSGSGYGVGTANAGVTVTHGAIRNFTEGVLLYQSSRDTASKLTVDDQYGVYLAHTSSTSVTSISATVTVTASPGIGILLDGADNNTVTSSTASNTTYTGIYEQLSSGNAFYGNTANNNPVNGIQLRGGANNVVYRNVFDGNGQDGIGIGDGPSGEASTNNTAYSNTDNNNHRYGVFIDQYATGATVYATTADNNGQDGFHIDNPSNTVYGNHADNNVGFGLWAVPGVSNWGDEAHGNGSPQQCLNVTCHS